MSYELRPKSVYFNGAAAMDFTWTPGVDVMVHAVRLHLSGVPNDTNEDFRVDLDSAEDSKHDVNFVKRDLKDEEIQDLIVSFDLYEGFMKMGDGLKCSYDNSDPFNWGVEIVYENWTIE